MGYEPLWRRPKLIPVVEASAYLAMAAGVLDEAERMAIVDRIAVDPRAGVLIKDTGGLRSNLIERPSSVKAGQ